MDVGAFVGVMLCLFFGGFGAAYGGYSVQPNHPVMALFSYVFGAGCITASIVLTFIRVGRQEDTGRTTTVIEAVSTSGESRLQQESRVTSSTRDNAERVLVPMTPQELVQPFEDHVSIQAQRITEAYIGKWLKTTGELTDINRYSDSWSVFLRIKGSDGFNMSGVSIALYFDLQWAERLAVLRRGMTMTVVGRIREIDSHRLKLEKCEIIDCV